MSTPGVPRRSLAETRTRYADRREILETYGYHVLETQ